jgi:hypothetical protein
MFYDVEFVKLPVFIHSSRTISIAETIYKMHVGVFFIYKHVRHFGYNTATQAWTVNKQELCQVTAVPACFTSN